MNRRQVILGLGAAAGSAVALGAPNFPRHWLDTWSSQDVEAVLVEMGAWQDFRRVVRRKQRAATKRRRREERGSDVVLFRGSIESLPNVDLRTVRAGHSRHDVDITTTARPMWIGTVELPAGSRLLVDSRATADRVLMAEVVRTPRGQFRAHVWALTPRAWEFGPREE